MKNTTAIFLFLLFAIGTNVHANKEQAFPYADPVRPLKVGDQLPDLLVKGIVNYHKKNVRMREFRGKYLLLDFWASGCVSCFSGFKRLVGYQKTYEKDFQAIIVNPYETKEQVKTRLADPKTARKKILPDLPAIIGDTIWDQWFPFPTLGQQVWIDRNGKIVGITNAYNVNPGTIEELISTGTMNNVLMASSFHYDLKQNRLRNILDTIASSVTPHSIFSAFYTGEGSAPFGLQSGRVVDSTRSTVRYSFMNHTYSALFNRAMTIAKETRGMKSISFPEMIFQMSHPGYFIMPEAYEQMDDYITIKSFCYEIELPLTEEKVLPDIMWRELGRHIGETLNVYARLEYRPRLTYVMRLVNPALLPLTAGGQSNKIFPGEKGEKVNQYSNKPLTTVLKDLAYELKDRELLADAIGFKPLPVALEVNSDANIDLKIVTVYGRGSNRNFFIDLKKQLKAIGVEIVEEYRDTEVMVLYNK